MAGGQSHSYQIELATGQYLKLVVEQRGIDVVVRLFSPTGEKVMEVDSPNGPQGPEPLAFVAQAAGSYRLEVEAFGEGEARGKFEVKIEDIRTPTEQDKQLIAAEKIFAEGMLSKEQGTAASLRDAIKRYEEAARLFHGTGDEVRRAAVLEKTAVAYWDLGEWQITLDYYTQALALYRALGERSVEATLLANIGTTYGELGERQKALNYLTQALPLRRADHDLIGEASTLDNIGIVYGELGERQKALDYYAQARALYRDAGYQPGEAETLGDIGFLYGELGEWQQARDHFLQALPLMRGARNRIGEATTLAYIGGAYHGLRNGRKALEYYAQALALQSGIGDSPGKAATLRSIGDLYRGLSQSRKALDCYTQALVLFRSIEARPGEARALIGVGLAYGDLGERQKALDSFTQALSLLHAVGDRAGEAETLNDLARVYDESGEPQKAFDLSRDALAIVEDLRTKIGSGELRTSFLAAAQGYYSLHLDILMQMHRRQPGKGFDALAFQVGERSRARSLLDLLNESHTDIRRGVAPALLERESSLLQLLAAKAEQQVRLLNSDATEERKTAADKEVRDISAGYRQVQAEIRAQSPGYAALTQPQPLSLARVQQDVLDDDTLLLQYSLGAKRSYLWAVTPATMNSYELPAGKEIETAARRVYELLSARQRRGKETAARNQARVAKADADYTGAARSLSRMVLGPAAAELGDKRLVIVADGALHYVPFSALPDPMRPGRPTQPAGPSDTSVGDQPLLVRHEIVNLPSASALAVLRQETQNRASLSKVVAVLADPVFDSSDPRLRRAFGKQASASRADATGVSRNNSSAPEASTSAADASTAKAVRAGRFNAVQRYTPASRALRELRSERGGLRRLVFSGEEAHYITDFVPVGQRLLAMAFDANRRTALSEQLAEYRYVHFATHGILNAEHPELSGIVLSLLDERGNRQDGFLDLSEIYNLHLPVEMVTLSACSTALGKEIKGEGIVGLSRGFMHAGAKRVLSSLWSVEDSTTAEMMKRMYAKMLIEGERPAAALRKAQLEMWTHNQWRAPYYWAAFILQGEWRSSAANNLESGKSRL